MSTAMGVSGRVWSVRTAQISAMEASTVAKLFTVRSEDVREEEIECLGDAIDLWQHTLHSDDDEDVLEHGVRRRYGPMAPLDTDLLFGLVPLPFTILFVDSGMLLIFREVSEINDIY